MKKSWILPVLMGLFLGSCASVPMRKTHMLSFEDIRIRDPFIFAHETTGTYYMYAQMGNRLERTDQRKGVEVYTSKDLEHWHGPQPVFLMPPDFWGQVAVWAPEVHEYNGSYYLFVTFTSDQALPAEPNRPPNQLRGTSILKADSPVGLFEPFANKPHTPGDWMALDGTLWVEAGRPWMVFCHEWTQVTDGAIVAVQLSEDLSEPIGNPVTLFKASDAEWVRRLGRAGAADIDKFRGGFVTDGCFLYRTQTGRLLMIWSSFGEQEYAVGMAYSLSGKITGPWKQIHEPLFKANGGHGMLFRTFEGKLMLVLHQPNKSPNERARLFELADTGDTLVLQWAFMPID